MKPWKLVVRSLLFYRRTHVGVLVGTVIAVAILVGALVVGDSVRGSLEGMVEARLGRTELALSGGDRFFRAQLAEELATELNADVEPVMQLSGIAVGENQQLRINGVQILGVGKDFFSPRNTRKTLNEKTGKSFGESRTLFSKRVLAAGGPSARGGVKGEAVINRRIALRLGLKEGDEFLLRIEKPEAMPGDVPMASQEGSSVAVRLTVGAVAGDDGMGRFSLRANQVPPFTVFLPLEFLASKIEQEGRANVLLAAGREGETLDLAEAQAALGKLWRLGDAGLSLRELSGGRGWELLSERVFIDPPIEDAALVDESAKGILTYFVNSIKGATPPGSPYSFMSAPGAPLVPTDMADDEVILNQWAAEDLGAGAGDFVEIAYFVPGKDHQLEEKTSRLRVREVVPIDGPAADRELMPIFPGLSGADNCRDWDPGIPVDLDRIRDKDEVYWDTYGGTPKAFVTLKAARRMWGNRFGRLTAVRYEGYAGAKEELAAAIMQPLEPEMLGLTFRAVRDEGLRAGSGGVDFGQLFIGLSFFIIAAALLLTGLLFALGIEQRGKETGIFSALGFTPKQTRRYLLAEGAVIALTGSVLGVVGGILYNQGVLYLLGTLWSGALGGAGSSALYLHLETQTLLIGGFSGFAMAVLTMLLAARKQVRRPVLELLGKLQPADIAGKKGKPGISLLVAALCFVGVSVIIMMVGPGKGKEAMGAFWGAGFLMLTGCLVLCSWFLGRLNAKTGKPRMAVSVLGRRNAARKRGRSLTTIALLSFGIFVVMAVGANRHSALQNADQRSAGTGGFAFYGETTLPLLKSLNDPNNQRDFGLEGNEPGLGFVQMRLREGDDASCLNLNRVSRPRILAVSPELFAEREAFSFVKTIDGADVENPWLLLNQKFEDGVIPAVADQSVIIWGLGKKVGDVLTYKNERGEELKLKLVGGLANSVFQGSVIISEAAFTRHFPSLGGSRVVLIDTAVESRDGVYKTLSRTMQDYGLELVGAGERLAMFSMVENTYLSIFLALGGLGLLLGTVGLGIVVSRNVMERRSELALMRAVGFTRKLLNRMLLAENFLLLVFGVITGVVSALVAVLPALMSPGVEIPFIFLLITLIVIILNGLFWVTLASKAASRGDLIPALRNE